MCWFSDTFFRQGAPLHVVSLCLFPGSLRNIKGYVWVFFYNMIRQITFLLLFQVISQSSCLASDEICLFILFQFILASFCYMAKFQEYNCIICLVNLSSLSSSVINLMSLSADICRVCRSEGTPEKPLYHPCVCTGSIKFIHQEW